MSFGSMNKKASIIEKINVTDAEGFTRRDVRVLANIRVFVEGRHASPRWANLAAFTEATDLFRFRIIPRLDITTSHYILFDGIEYNILSVENIKGRNMYIEVLAKKVVPTNG